MLGAPRMRRLAIRASCHRACHSQTTDVISSAPCAVRESGVIARGSGGRAFSRVGARPLCNCGARFSARLRTAAHGAPRSA